MSLIQIVLLLVKESLGEIISLKMGNSIAHPENLSRGAEEIFSKKNE